MKVNGGMVDLYFCRMGGGLQAKRSLPRGKQAVMPRGDMALPITVIPSRYHRRGISARKNLVPALRSLSSVSVSALPFADAAARVSRVPLDRPDKRAAYSRRAPFARLSPRRLFLPQRAKRITYPPKPRKTLLRALGESTGAFLPVAANVKTGGAPARPFHTPAPPAPACRIIHAAARLHTPARALTRAQALKHLT